MDPLTRGSLVHAVQTEFYGRMRTQGRLPVRAAALGEALELMDECVTSVSRAQHDQLAPAIERVWADEVGFSLKPIDPALNP